MNIKGIFILIFLTFFQLILVEGNRRRRLLRVGVRPDPPLAPFTNTSHIYISYTKFLRGFINSQGLFNIYAPIPTNSTYAAFMNVVVADGGIEDRNELSAFMAHVLVASKGFTQLKESNTSLFDDLTRSYIHRGYFGINGVDEYKQASLSIFKDLRLLEAPELILQDEPSNWKVALWKWKRSAWKRIDGIRGKSSEVVYKVYKILKKEWDPKSESY